MAARPGGPRGPTDPSYGQPYQQPPPPLQQQYMNTQYYESESDVGDPYARRDTYLSDGNGSRSNSVLEHQYYDNGGNYDYCEYLLSDSTSSLFRGVGECDVESAGAKLTFDPWCIKSV